MTTEFETQAAKGSVAVIGAAASLLTLNHIVAIVTIIYVVIQTAYLVRKWWREEQRKDSGGISG